MAKARKGKKDRIHEVVSAAVQDNSNEPVGLTYRTVKQILRRNKLPVGPFNKWMHGQTCPVVEVEDDKVPGLMNMVIGVYRWDLERYLSWKLKGICPLWD